MNRGRGMNVWCGDALSVGCGRAAVFFVVEEIGKFAL